MAGRVKIIYARKGDDVAKCMYEHGALAVLSLDGTMSLQIESQALSAGDKVTVRRENGKELDGKVESVTDGMATILVTDDGRHFFDS